MTNCKRCGRYYTKKSFLSKLWHTDNSKSCMKNKGDKK